MFNLYIWLNQKVINCSTTITAHLYTTDNVECLGAEAACDVTVNRVRTEIDQDDISVYVGQKVTVEYAV